MGAAQTSAHPNWPIPKVLNSWLHRSITSSLLAVLSTLYFSFSIHFMRDIYKEMVYTEVRGEEVQDQGQVGEGRKGYRWRRPTLREEAPYPRLPNAKSWESGLKLSIQFLGQLRLSLWVFRAHPLICPCHPYPFLPERAWLTPRLGREGTVWCLCLRNVDRELFPQPSFWKRRARNRPSQGH